MLSQLTTLSWSSPFRGPTRTSLVIPRIVLVIGVAESCPAEPTQWCASVQREMRQVT
jgi:hypothetical protein